VTSAPSPEATRTARPSDDIAPLSVADRCDKCGAQAFMRAVFPGGGELLFCGHHGREYAAALSGSSVQLVDETGRLNDRPGTDRPGPPPSID